MPILILIAIVTIIVCFAINKSKSKATTNLQKNNNSPEAVPGQQPEEDTTSHYQYRLKTRIMTPKEEDSYRKLIKVFDSKFYIIPQVHLGVLFDHKIKGQNWYGAFQHINRKSVDYVLLNKETLKPVCAVELDDYTHNFKNRQERDREVERIFDEAKLPLVRLRNITSLSNREIIDSFAKIINQ